MLLSLSNISSTMWQSFLHIHFFARLQALEAELERMRKKCPEKLKGHPLVRLYVAIIEVMRHIMADPTHEKYLLGNTLGTEHRDWRRAKEGLPPRYRLFFKFFSEHREIYFGWINDSHSLRKDGAKTDCYVVFRRMLDRSDVPSTRDELHDGSTPAPDMLKQ